MSGPISVLDTITGRFTIGDQLRRHARHQPDHLALVHVSQDGVETARLTYRDLDRRVNRLAWSLADRGIGRGDVVAAMSPNSAEYVVLYLAAARLGAVMSGVNYLFQDDEIVYQIGHAEPAVLLVDAPLTDRIDRLAGRIPPVRVLLSSAPATQGSWTAISELYAEHLRDDEPPSGVVERDPLFVVYTSGTEALPKAVVIPHRNYAIATAPAWGIGAQSENDVLTGGIVRTYDRWLHLTPLHTIAGIGNLTIVLCIGASVVMPAVVEAGLAIELIDRERCTATVQTPTFFLSAVRHPTFAAADLSSVQRLLTYGATMPEAMISGWNGKSPRLMWATYWGQSELTQLGCTGWFRELSDIPGGDISWIGRPVAALELILVDADGQEVGVGEVGEAWCRTPAVMLGYHKDPERTRETFAEGWLHTGDLMRRDAAGNLFFADRRKDMIKTGGYNVSSQEVEKVLYAHPSVAQVAVVGLLHEYWSEAVTAFVVLRPGTTATDVELTDLCRTRVVNYKVPKAVVFVESLPVDSQGKVLKRELRRLHHDHYDPVVTT